MNSVKRTLRYSPSESRVQTKSRSLNLISSSYFAAIVSTLVITLFFAIEKAPSVVFSYVMFGGVGFLISRIVAGSIGRQLFIIIYGVATVAAVILYYTYIARYGTPYIAGGSDDLSYEQSGLIIAQSFRSYDFDEIGFLIGQQYHNSKGYIYLVSLLVHLGDALGGFHTMLPRIFNCMVLGLISVFVFSISRELSLNNRRATTVALVYGLFPIMVWISVHTFRDPIVALILVMVVRFALVIQQKPQLGRQILSIAAILFLTVVMIEFRQLNIFVIIAILSTVLYMRFMRNAPYWVIISLCAMLLAIAYSFKTEGYNTGIGRLLEKNLEGFREHRASVSPGLSKTLFTLPFPLNILGRVGYSIVSPLPQIYKEIEWIFISMGTIVQIMFAPYLLLGIYATWSDRKKLLLLVAFATTYTGYTFGSFSVRHLMQVIPFAVIIIGFGYQRYSYMRNQIIISTSAIIFLLGIIYLALKNYI
jgi:hypothetical protein